jgi:hypothetical protein
MRLWQQLPSSSWLTGASYLQETTKAHVLPVHLP